MTESSTQPCAHESCQCQVPSGQLYCSEHCREAASSRTRANGCNCGHPACRQEEPKIGAP